MGYLIVAMLICTLCLLIGLRITQNNIIRYIDSIALKESDIKPNTEHTEIDKSLRNEKGFFSYKKYIG